MFSQTSTRNAALGVPECERGASRSSRMRAWRTLEAHSSMTSTKIAVPNDHAQKLSVRAPECERGAQSETEHAQRTQNKPLTLDIQRCSATSMRIVVLGAPECERGASRSSRMRAWRTLEAQSSMTSTKNAISTPWLLPGRLVFVDVYEGCSFGSSRMRAWCVAELQNVCVAHAGTH